MVNVNTFKFALRKVISKQVAQRKEADVVDSVLALASLESGATNASRLPHFMLTLIVLPRQARDKHSESTQKKRRRLRGDAAAAPAAAAASPVLQPTENRCGGGVCVREGTCSGQY